MAKGKKGFVTTELLGDQAYVDMLKELDYLAGKQLVIDALFQGGNLINQKAQSFFAQSKRNKSETGYASFNSLFKVEKGKKHETSLVKVGMKGKDAYKYRWANYGTKERFRIGKKGKYSVGKVAAQFFFTDAVLAYQTEVKAMVSNALIESLKAIKNGNN